MKTFVVRQFSGEAAFEIKAACFVSGSILIFYAADGREIAAFQHWDSVQTKEDAP